MKLSQFKPIFKYLRLINFGLLGLYFIIIYNTDWRFGNHQKSYSKELSCYTVVNVKLKSSYKGKPSIVVKKGSDSIEIFEQFGYNADLDKIKVGDKIFKEKYTFNFVLLDQYGIRYDYIYQNSDYFDPFFNIQYSPKIGNLNCECK